MSKKIIFSEEQINHMINLWNDTQMSCKEIGDVFGVSESPIKRILKANNIVLKNKHQFTRIKTVTDNFFEKIDNEDKAYWLGFICADGYVENNRIGIGLAICDYNHIVKFKNTIESDTEIRITDNGNSCDFRFTSIKMKNDLKKMGIVNNKTFLLNLSRVIEYVPSDLINHFVRGYFDGDGTISQNKNTMQPIFHIVVIKQNIKPLSEILKIYTKPIQDKRATDSWYIQAQSIKEIQRIYKFLYNDAKVYLNRKKDKYENIIRTIEEVQRA